LLPPLVITNAQLDQLAAAINEVLTSEIGGE
jgi:adenosylmethionine-8-amino-7-oxononanoate aminotransferase